MNVSSQDFFFLLLRISNLSWYIILSITTIKNEDAHPLLPALDHDPLQVLNGERDVFHSVTVSNQVSPHHLSKA